MDNSIYNSVSRSRPHPLMQEAVTPLPKARLAVLCLISMNEGFQGNIVWTFVPFMVRDFFDGSDGVGIYVGLIASSFFFFQFLGAPFWGRAADKWGRRPILLTGLLGTVSGQLIMGFATNYPMALGGRALSGLLNANLGVLKAYLAEITDHTNQAKGFSMIGVSFGIAGLFAPALGGFVAKPADTIGGIFDTDFWRKYPYLLPCLFGCIASIIGFFAGLCFLPESEVWLETKKGNAAVKLDGDEEGQPAYASLENAQIDGNTQRERSEGSNSKENVDIEDMTDYGTPVGSRRCSFLCFPCYYLTSSFPSYLRGDIGWCISLYAIGSLAVNLDLELFPLYCEATKDNGGLALSSSQIGTFLTFSGVSLVIYQLFLFSKVTKKFGLHWTYRIATFVFTCYLTFFPTVGLIYKNTSFQVLFVVVALSMTIKAACLATFLTTSVIMVNNGTPKELGGVVNGIAQAAGCFGRSIGPLIGGGLWSWNEESDKGYSTYVVYWCVAVVCISSWIVLQQISKNVDKPLAAR